MEETEMDMEKFRRETETHYYSMNGTPRVKIPKERVEFLDLAGKIAAICSLPESEVKRLLRATFWTILREAESGKAVILPGLGLFHVFPKRKSQVVCLNTNTKVTVPGRKILRFKPSGTAKLFLNPDLGKSFSKSSFYHDDPEKIRRRFEEEYEMLTKNPFEEWYKSYENEEE